MFAGKTDELIRKIKKLNYAGYKCQIFKPSLDDRFQKNHIVSHDQNSIPAILIDKSENIKDYLDLDTHVIGIDEIQFFDKNLPQIANELTQNNKIVICAGLDKNFRGQIFDHVLKTAVYSKSIIKLHAICVICGNRADRTQRVINGKYATWNDPIILVGDKNEYEARCRFHHVINKQ